MTWSMLIATLSDVHACKLYIVNKDTTSIRRFRESRHATSLTTAYVRFGADRTGVRTSWMLHNTRASLYNSYLSNNLVNVQYLMIYKFYRQKRLVAMKFQ